MTKKISIENYNIGHDFPPFIIAEMSGNHNQSLERALEIVDEIAKTGASAIKIQTYTADTLTIDIARDEFMVYDQNSERYGKSLYQLYQEAYTPWEWHKPIFDRAKEHGLVAFSTPFDASAVDFLEELEVPCYKIASFENTYLDLIERVAKTGKPIIISTGMASKQEIGEAVATAREAGCNDLILLKCTSAYPASAKDSHIKTMQDIEQQFDVSVGLSDHTLGIGVAVASVALGAVAIEKHVTLNRKDGGVDSDFSLEPSEVSLLVSETKRAWESLGNNDQYSGSDAEQVNKKYRRSLYVVEDIKAGEVITNKHIRAIRPGLGLPSKYAKEIIGKKAKLNLQRGTPLSFDHVA